MIARPKFSVIIPTYNRAYILEKSVNSVLAQTCEDYELILVDDGSTDATSELIRNIIQSERPGAERIRHVAQQQQGKSSALNHGVRIAAGEWIAFLDSDDLWLPSKLELQLRALEEFDNCDVCFTDAQYINNPKLNSSAFRRAGREHVGAQGRIDDALEFVINEPHGIYEQTIVVRASRLREMDGFDSNIRVLEDHDFVFRLAHHVKRFCYVNSALVQIDRTPVRAVGLIDLFRKDEVRLRDQQYIYEKWLRIEGLSELVRCRIHTYLRAVYSGWASWYLQRREYGKARQAMATAIRHQFTATMALKWILTVAMPGVMRRYLLRSQLSAAESEI